MRTIDAEHSQLRDIPVDTIERNPDNPRIVFRTEELGELLESIRRYGVQVPILVYRQTSRYVLIDGERRWRCCLKLNKKTIPALVHQKPDPLTNLLLMFNIHALREQWDLFTIAMKLPRIIALLTDQLGTKPNERELAEQTGLSRGVIRRCKLLIELPERYRKTIFEELHKPKAQQKLTEDFFIEMERSLKTVERSMREVIPNKDGARRVLIDKYKKGIIKDITDFREVAKIARAENVEVDRNRAESVLVKLFERNDYSIQQAYQDSVSEAYLERDLRTHVSSLIDQLEELRKHDIDEQLRVALENLLRCIRDLLSR